MCTTAKSPGITTSAVGAVGYFNNNNNLSIEVAFLHRKSTTTLYNNNFEACFHETYLCFFSGCI